MTAVVDELIVVLGKGVEHSQSLEVRDFLKTMFPSATVSIFAHVDSPFLKRNQT